MHYLFTCLVIAIKTGAAIEYYETDHVNFRVDAGTRTCFFENGEAGQTLELYYQVLNGQHGDLDISVDVTDPTGTKLVSDYKLSQNSITTELEHDGDYVFCLDNTYSVMNSKLVFMNVVIEHKIGHKGETEASTEGEHGALEEDVEWVGSDEEGNYTIPVAVIIESLKRTSGYVVRARHMLDIYAATKSRDSHMAFEGTLIVDLWSSFQIVFMICVGMVQVYMIKKLFNSPCPIKKY